MRPGRTAGSCVSAMLLIGACSSSSDQDVSGPAQSVSQTGAGTSISVPTTSALPEVLFDPCNTINDAMVAEFGLDPSTRSRDHGYVGEKEYNACNFHTDHRGLVIIAQNRRWEELPSTLSTIPDNVTVNGREALFAIGAVGSDSCVILMRTSFGAVIVDSAPFRGGDADPNMHACDGIWDIAQAIEPLIDDGI